MWRHKQCNTVRKMNVKKATIPHLSTSAHRQCPSVQRWTAWGYPCTYTWHAPCAPVESSYSLYLQKHLTVVKILVLTK